MVFQYLMITPVFFTKHKYETPILRFSKPKEIFHVWKCENWRFPRSIVQLAADGCSIEQQSKAEPALSPSIFPLYKRAGPHPAKRPTFIRPPGTKHEIGLIRKGFISKRAKSRKPEPGWLVRKCSVSKRMADQADLGTRSPSRLTRLAREPLKKAPRRPVHARVIQNAPKITSNIRACGPELETNVLDWCLYENFENTLEYQSYCAASRNSLEKTAVDSKQLDSWSCSYCTRIVWLILVDADTGCIWWDAPYSCSCSCSYCTRLHVTRSPLQRRQRAAQRCIAEAVGTEKRLCMKSTVLTAVFAEVSFLSALRISRF